MPKALDGKLTADDLDGAPHDGAEQVFSAQDVANRQEAALFVAPGEAKRAGRRPHHARPQQAALRVQGLSTACRPVFPSPRRRRRVNGSPNRNGGREKPEQPGLQVRCVGEVVGVVDVADRAERVEQGG